MNRMGRTSPWWEAIRQSGALVALACVLAVVSNGLRSDGLPWLGSDSPVSNVTVGGGLGLEIPLEEAQILFFTKEAVFLDARSPEVYARGHIEGALNLPWGAFEERAPVVLANIPKETPIVTYCDGESCGLSYELAVALIARGYTHVMVLANGWSVWTAHDLPTSTGP